ncbi:MAG: hypothetical protein ACYTAN_06895 [Planctomycetota bacterium]|jgi:hypothetical protein
MDRYTSDRSKARELKRELMRWHSDRTDLCRRYEDLQRQFRRRFGDEGLAADNERLFTRAAALSDALDAILDQ